MQPPERRSLLDLALRGPASSRRYLADAWTQVPIAALAHATNLASDPEQCRDRCVMIVTARQLTAALALVALDGIARRILLCTPDLTPDQLRVAAIEGRVDIIICDDPVRAADLASGLRVILCGDSLRAATVPASRSIETEWVLFTSGTTGGPKLVVHTIAGLTGAMAEGTVPVEGPIWATFYDIRRYGGLQILLRALSGNGVMLLTDPHEALGDFLLRAGRVGVSHISGTPSHWRRALMSGFAARLSPSYVRLSGEACDQAILDNLQRAYPGAGVAHAFASTEAGVAFEVRDRRAGFPVALIGGENGEVELKVEESSLRIRSSRTALRYLGSDVPAIRGADGFVDTGDLLEQRGDRFHFNGRREGVINVGGLKVHPEAVEAVINRHPAISMSRVSARRNPITGAIVVAEFVRASRPGEVFSATTITNEILGLCRQQLPAHAVPVNLREVAALEIAASGKLVRHRA